MAFAQDGRPSLSRCFCVLLTGLMVSADVVKAQAQDIPIRGVRLQPNSTNYDNSISGLVQVLTEGWQWVHLSSPSYWWGYLSDSVGEVLCRQIGYGNYTGYNSERRYYAEALDVGQFMCNGSEHSLNECARKYHLMLNNSINVIGITCAESNCARDNGGCAQVCRHNSFDPTNECSCWKGYAVSTKNRKECVDVDECLTGNGGCDRVCVNTLGSFHCTCPTYAYWDEKTRKCTEFGSTVECNSDGMTAAFSKEAYPMLRTDGTSLLDRSCRRRENATHYIFGTRYEKCMTTKEITSGGFKYTNVITSNAKDRPVGLIRFSSLIHISFSCLINKTAHSVARVTSEPMTLKSVAESVFDPAVRLFVCMDASCTKTQGMTQFKQTDIIYSRLSLLSQDYDVKFSVKDCDVCSNDGMNATCVSLIANGTSSVEWVKIVEPSDHRDFVFHFPAFTFEKPHKSLKVKCKVSVTTQSSNRSSSVLVQNETALSNASVVGSVSVTTQSSNRSSTNLAQNETAPSNASVVVNPQRDNDYPLVHSCDEAKYDGIHRLVTSNFVVNVWCDVTSDDGPWLTFMRRTNDGLNFTKTWKDYEDGFGTADKEFWLGNKFLHLVTKVQTAALRITLTTFSNVTLYTDYGVFGIADSLSEYRLTIDEHSGSAGDMRNATGCTFSGAFQSSANFSTYDRDNDDFDSYSCAEQGGGGWWYFGCNCSCLTCGTLINGAAFMTKGVIGYPSNDLYVLKATEMKLRFPKLAQDPKVTQDSVKSVNGSAVSCNLEEMTLTLERTIFDQPEEEHNLIVNSDSLTSQSLNATHFIFKFNLLGMDTTRQVYSDFIHYKKKVSITPQYSRYYSNLDVTILCSARKDVVAEQSYSVENADVDIQFEATGIHRVQLLVYADDEYKTPLDVSRRLSEGDEIYVKAVPVHSLSGTRLSISSCSVRGILNSDNALRIIQNRCPLLKDVHMMAPDSFAMRTFSLKESKSIHIQCEVEACPADGAECFAACDDAFRKRRPTRSISAMSVAVTH